VTSCIEPLIYRRNAGVSFKTYLKKSSLL
jgi:hypothetical protein